MADAKLVLHVGARQVPRADLVHVPTPPATATWFPVAHATVIDTVEQSLTNAGFAIEKADYGLSRNDARMFATMRLNSPLVPGVALAIGVRNSTDQSFPLGFCAGSSVFVCDNLAFRSDLLVKRKHTKNGHTRFREAIAAAVVTLDQFRQHEAKRIQAFQFTDINDERAESLMLKSFESGIVSHRVLPKVIKEWRKPSYEDFTGKNLWSLLNAFTHVLNERAKSNPQMHAGITMRLGGLLDDSAGLKPFAIEAAPANGEPANAA